MKYVVGAIIGAVIGYLTNWLAIKMLFRPHEEKRIFGIKVPFTPGLIPKEQKRIAASVGSAVGEYLLTEETIINNLRSDKVQEHIRTSLKRKVNDICESKRTIGDSFSFILKDNYEKVAEFIKGKIVANVEKELHKPEIQNKILEVSEEQVKRFLEKNELPHIRFHDLRHSHVTLLINSKVPIKVISERVGHSNISTTLSVYSHVLKEMDKEASDNLSELLFK